MKYELYFTEQNETLRILDSEDKPTEIMLPLFGITNAFLSALHSLNIHTNNVNEAISSTTCDSIRNALDEFHKRVVGENYSESTTKTYLPFLYSYSVWADFYKNEDIGKVPVSFYLAEYISLYKAVTEWLVPPSKDDLVKYYPLDRFCNRGFDFTEPNDLSNYLQYILTLEKGQELGIPENKEGIGIFLNQQYVYEIFYNRTRQISSGKKLTQVNGEIKPMDIYSSDNLISLAWIEILHALDNNLYARVCTNCGKVYYVQRPYTAMTCSLRCYFRKYRMEYPGGEQAFKNKRAAERREKRHQNR